MASYYDDDYKDTEKYVKKKKVNVFNIVVYVVASALILTGVTILLRENILIFKDQTDGLVDEQDYLNNVYPVIETYKPLATPVSEYDIIPVKIHFIDVKVNGTRSNVSSDIYPTGIGDDGVMETVGSARDCSWLSQLPYVVPGDVGNAVIAGHNLWKGEAGTFSVIKNMQKGDTVAVTFDVGFTRYFEVIDTYKCRYSDTTPMITDGVDEPILTLVTCMGDWSDELQQSKHRFVVVCKPVNNN